MRYLLDTNVISELVKPRPDDGVVAWVKAQSQLDLAISVLTLGEIEQGVARLAPGSRRTRLEQWASTELPRQFLGRLLSVDESVARAWGRLSGAGQTIGRPLSVIDGLLLATAEVRQLTFVTRDVRDCGGRGVPILDPWTN